MLLAQRDKEARYSELVAAERCRLVVVALETGGWWSAEALSFIEEMAQARARDAPFGCILGVEEAVDQNVVLATGRSPLPWLQVRTTRCRGSMERHLTWPTCLGRCERVLLCARILTVGLSSAVSLFLKKKTKRKKGEPHQRSPNAPKFEDRSQEETEWQEQGAREAAWKLAKNVLKFKEHERATFFSPPENRCLPASNLKPEEREFVVDSEASMHMISKKDLSNAEMDTLTKSCSPTLVITANGEVQTHEEATVCQRIGYILDYESPRKRASSVVAKAL